MPPSAAIAGNDAFFLTDDEEEDSHETVVHDALYGLIDVKEGATELEVRVDEGEIGLIERRVRPDEGDRRCDEQ
jgi:hypothetical protein